MVNVYPLNLLLEVLKILTDIYLLLPKQAMFSLSVNRNLDCVCPLHIDGPVIVRDIT